MSNDERYVRVLVGVSLIMFAIVVPAAWAWVGLYPLVTGALGSSPIFRMLGIQRQLPWEVTQPSVVSEMGHSFISAESTPRDVPMDLAARESLHPSKHDPFDWEWEDADILVRKARVTEPVALRTRPSVPRFLDDEDVADDDAAANEPATLPGMRRATRV